VCVETKLVREAAEIETVAAPCIENHIASRRVNRIGDPAQQRLRHAAIVQSPPRRYGRKRVSRVLGSAILRLQEINVSASCDVEGVSLRTEHALSFAPQLPMAAPHGANEHDRL
jgi:hypothetical protein